MNAVSHKLKIENIVKSGGKPRYTLDAASRYDTGQCSAGGWIGDRSAATRRGNVQPGLVTALLSVLGRLR